MIKKYFCTTLSMLMLLSIFIPCYATDYATQEDYCSPSKSIVISSDLVSQYGLDEQLVTDALRAYKTQRENEFLSSDSTTVSSVAIESDLERDRFLEGWKDELNIRVIHVDAELCVKNVYTCTKENLKLLVYERVWIDYICNGYDKIETMAFGTNHILTLTRTEDKFQITRDSYSEITGYADLSNDDLSLLMYNQESIDDIEEYLYEEPDYSTAATSTYSAGAAVRYSNTWCGVSVAGTHADSNPAAYNPEYYYFKNDCCNFVSQCLYAGGMSMAGEWYATLNTSGTLKMGDESVAGSAWIRVSVFKEYWKGLGYTETKITSSNQAVAGNPLYDSGHIMLIVGTNSNGAVLVNGHNHDAYQFPISIGSNSSYYTLDLVHKYSTVISRTSSTHTLGCVICSATRTEPHTFASIASTSGSSVCTVCGYVSK